jgi:integrase
LEALELKKKALVWLKQHNIEPGCWYHPPNQPIPDDAYHALEDVFSAAYSHELGSKDDMVRGPASIQAQVQALAFKIATQPPETQTLALRFSDAWAPYIATRPTPKEKRQERARKKEQARWDEFLRCAGDREFTQENVTDALMKFSRHLSSRRKSNGEPLSPESRRRYMTPVKAALSMLAEDNLLAIQVKAPRVRGTSAERAGTYTFSLEEQKALVLLAGDQLRSGYKAWQELFVLIAIQTGAIASELQRMRPAHLDFSGIPVVYFEGELKTRERRRMVPLVVKPDRIKHLVEVVGGNSDRILGDPVANWDESAISKRMGELVRLVNPKAVPYSLRHSFRHAMSVAEVPEETQALFGGWSNKNINRSHQSYAKTGLEHQERLKQLARVCERAFAHLIEDDDNEGNVVALRGRRA